MGARCIHTVRVRRAHGVLPTTFVNIAAATISKPISLVTIASVRRSFYATDSVDSAIIRIARRDRVAIISDSSLFTLAVELTISRIDAVFICCTRIAGTRVEIAYLSVSDIVFITFANVTANRVCAVSVEIARKVTALVDIGALLDAASVTHRTGTRDLTIFNGTCSVCTARITVAG